jgi:hypothetical protein
MASGTLSEWYRHDARNRRTSGDESCMRIRSLEHRRGGEGEKQCDDRGGKQTRGKQQVSGTYAASSDALSICLAAMRASPSSTRASSDSGKSDSTSAAMVLAAAEARDASSTSARQRSRRATTPRMRSSCQEANIRGNEMSSTRYAWENAPKC